MSSIKASADTRYRDQVNKLKREYENLKNEFSQNNEIIRDLQIRDRESVENMKYYLEKKRQLNDRAKKLKQLILKNFLERKGSTLKIDEWLSAFNIPLDFKPNSEPSTKSLQDCNSENLSEFDASIRPKTDEFLDQLAFKIENIMNTVSFNELGQIEPQRNHHFAASDADTESIHIEKSRDFKYDSVESVLRYCQQYEDTKTTPPAVVTTTKKTEKSQSTSELTLSPLSPPSNLIPPVIPTQAITPTETNTMGLINYPDNVNLKTDQSLPSLYNSNPIFATKYEIKRKRKGITPPPSSKADKYKSKLKLRKNTYDVVKSTSAKPFFNIHSPTPISESTISSKLLNFFYTVTALAALLTLLYHCPTPGICLQILKNTVYQTKDDLADTLTYINLPGLLNSEKSVVKNDYEPNTWQHLLKFLENWYLKIWW